MNYIRSPFSRRARGALIFVVGGLVLLAMLAGSGAAWAEPPGAGLRATVPTPTPRHSPTALPTATTPPAPPTATSAPTATLPPPTAGPGPTQAPTATQPPAPVQPTATVPAPSPTPCVACALPGGGAGGVFVNCGGGRLTDSTGQVWLADQPYSQGETSFGYVVGEAETGSLSGTQPVKGTPDSLLYQTERWGMSGYRFGLPNGTYQVTLKFVEQFATAKGQRVFDVTLQGAPVLVDFDILAAAGGPLIAVDRTFTVTLAAGTLQVGFVRKADNPTIAAIAVRPVASAPAPSAVPSAGATGAPAATPAPATATPSTVSTRQTVPAATATSAATSVPSPASTPLPMTPPLPTSTAPAGARVVALSPGSATALRSPDGAVHVLVPAGAVSQPQSLAFIPTLAEQARALPVGMTPTGLEFTLQPLDPVGLPISSLQWQQPVTIVVGYTKDDLRQAGGQPSRLALGRYDTATQQWVIVETQVDRTAATLAGRSSTPGLYALMLRGAPSAGGLSTTAIVLLGLGVVAFLAVAVYAVWLTRRGKKG